MFKTENEEIINGKTVNTPIDKNIECNEDITEKFDFLSDDDST